jgi:hypothetical protein
MPPPPPPMPQAPPVAPARPVTARQEPFVLRAQPVAPPAPTAPAPARNTGARSSGWLSDLLQRAAREDDEEEQAPPPRQTPAQRKAASALESLDSISVDIARMIDHDAAVELWDRYKRGERNVFSRRLYTLQGQQTFDELRRRYRRDAEFQETVDRYVEEFERLLAEVAKDDRDSMIAKTYLTSETGKVYTMLAHASGRFE